MQTSTFHAMLRPAVWTDCAVCLFFLSGRTIVPSRNSMFTEIQMELYTTVVSASVCTLAQFVPLQMSEPWHSSKPARHTGCRGDRRVQG